ncbi:MULTISPECIES: hypothetical protein [unclassified Streptomyces]|uniref:hypothetical protein n=1 Tax=unclassified Streptomyces TaxID=2593676 RepID=UPI00081DF499|nr:MULTISPECIES: hypothetical protein [unclassified Streptomyces]SCF70436.1 hypothetical protein GA0115259_101288 [Streptomyces sp. MnatMP-M17]
MSDPDIEVDPLERVLHSARALVLADLIAGDVARAEVVSLVEESVSHRRWWVEQWPEGAAYVAGLVAQDVQDALMERYGRWPLCPVCAETEGVETDGVESEPHALDVEPELGPDPHWVCGKAGVVIAAVGSLGSVLGPPDDSDGPGGSGDSGGPGGPGGPGASGESGAS